MITRRIALSIAPLPTGAAEAGLGRNKAREGDLDAAVAETAGLEAALLKLVGIAKAKAEAPPGALEKPKPKLPSLASLTGDIKGGFVSPFAARQFAYGDTVAKRQLQAAENAAKALGILPKIDTHIVDIAKKLKFGR